jgi:hypothetical protein
MPPSRAALGDEAWELFMSPWAFFYALFSQREGVKRA